MTYSVFVSHSMRQEDLGIVYMAAQDAATRDIACYIAERDWQFGNSLPLKIEHAIRGCDCFVAFWTQGGAYSAYVNQEIGVARGCNRPRILVVEKGVQVKGFEVDREFVELDRQDPLTAINALNAYLTQLKSAKEKQNAGLLVVAVFGFLYLLGNG